MADRQANAALGRLYREKFGRFPTTSADWDEAFKLGDTAASTAIAPYSGLRASFGKFKEGMKNNFGYKWTDNAKIGATEGPGITAFGKPIGKYANIAGGVMQGIQAAKGLSDYASEQEDLDNLLSSIKSSAMGNPLLNSYLTNDQISLLSKIQRGTYDTSADADDFMSGVLSEGLSSGIQNALMGAAMGGPWGALIGGVGGLVNGGISGLSNGSAESEAELQALLTALQNAEMQYKSMQRPNFTGLGIQQQYKDMYR